MTLLKKVTLKYLQGRSLIKNSTSVVVGNVACSNNTRNPCCKGGHATKLYASRFCKRSNLTIWLVVWKFQDIILYGRNQISVDIADLKKRQDHADPLKVRVVRYECQSGNLEPPTNRF
jgi:hypothetical protein